MKDFSEETWRENKPSVDAKKAIGFCLKQLFLDELHEAEDRVAGCCNYEELIGALLLAEEELNGPEETLDEFLARTGHFAS